MKKIQSLYLLLIMVLFGNLSAQIQHFTWQGVQRDYLVRTPANHVGTLPVMFFLHGLGDNITRCDQEYNFQQMAEEFGWAIVVPQARNLGMGNMWNNPFMYLIWLAWFGGGNGFGFNRGNAGVAAGDVQAANNAAAIQNLSDMISDNHNSDLTM